MTNREYNKKQHRGSSPFSVGPAPQSTNAPHSSVEWQDRTWYPDGQSASGKDVHQPPLPFTDASRPAPPEELL